jgi:hypothetical protein
MNLVGPLTSGLVESCLDTAADQDSKAVVDGTIMAVYVQPVISCLSDPTVHVSTVGTPSQIILDIATEAGGWYYPKTIIHLNTTGAAIANNYSDGIPVYGRINVGISDANYGDYVNVWLLVD